MMNSSVGNASSFHHTMLRPKGAKGMEAHGDVRRHVERLLLRLDFNGGFSTKKSIPIVYDAEAEILKAGGLA